MDWTKIKESLENAGKELVNAANEFVSGIKEDLRPKTMEERFADVKQTISENPDLTHDQIVDLLKSVEQKNETIEELKESLRWGYSEFKKTAKDIIDSKEMTKLKEKVDELLESDKAKEIRETIDLQNRMKKIIETGQNVTKVVSAKISEAIDEFSKKEDKTPDIDEE